jgi:hypothetical protein
MWARKKEETSDIVEPRQKFLLPQLSWACKLKQI